MAAVQKIGGTRPTRPPPPGGCATVNVGHYLQRGYGLGNSIAFGEHSGSG
jgi:hypothetical protein